MANDVVRLLTERVNLRIQLVSLVFVILGLGMMFLSLSVGGAGYHKTATLLEESGVAVFISGVLAVLWELAGKRAFADEILAKANMSRDLAEAGINVFTGDFRDHRIPWSDLFKCSNKLDIFVSYASTWRNIHLSDIERLLARNDGHMRVILSD